MKKIIYILCLNILLYASGFGNGFGNGFGGGKSYNFDAVDKNKEENITTKKIGYDIYLTVKEKDDKSFTGTVYTVARDENDNNLSDVNETEWDNETSKDVTLTGVDKNISKKAHIYIEWKYSKMMKTTSGENNSTDDFAIIPTKYLFNIQNNAVIKAGETYEVNATDDDNTTQLYDQNLSNDKSDRNATLIYHLNGNDTPENFNIEFKDGNAKFYIKDVGLYTLEFNDTNYSAIDEDDGTKEKDRTIYGEINVSVIPYKFKINLKNKTIYTPIYIGDKNYTLELNLTALNKQNEITANFDKDKNATDVNISLEFNNTLAWSNENIDLNYSITTKNSDDKFVKLENKLQDINYTLLESNFTNGVADFRIDLYMQKNISLPNSPVDINIKEVNTTASDIINDGLVLDDNITFYYTKLLTEDVFTTYKETNSSIVLLVYDVNNSDASNRDLNIMSLINWYKLNKEFDINNYIMKENSNFSSDNIDINLTLYSGIGENNISIDNNTTPQTTKGIIHLDTPSYLWYSKFNEVYSYSNSSNCINHYCITYQYKNINNSSQSDVGSGTFEGSEVNNTLEVNSSHKGIKLYR